MFFESEILFSIFHLHTSDYIYQYDADNFLKIEEQIQTDLSRNDIWCKQLHTETAAG